jgi:hypothetical protein
LLKLIHLISFADTKIQLFILVQVSLHKYKKH